MSDAGLQHERTSLAWRRSALATVALALVLARLGAEQGNPWDVVAAGWALASATAMSAVGRRTAARDLARRHTLVRTTALAVCGVSASALVAVATA